jgi:Ni/Fe-hydrogenase subunit HybB-like protein
MASESLQEPGVSGRGDGDGNGNGHDEMVLAPGHTYATVTDKISAIVLSRPYNWRWVLGISLSFTLLMLLTMTITNLLVFGPGIWGLDSPVMWAWDITNFVWWIGIGHAGTLISAILLLLKQDWRTSINRFAEAMTLFAVACAGSKNKWARIVYAIPAMGWRGSAIHWHRYRTAYLLLAGLATPLVVSVHTVVSFDFASGIVPGWHTTIFPPYFVAGAIFSGFAMVLTLAIPLRKAFALEDMITMKHLDNMGKVLLTTGLVVTYGYSMEAFFAYYSGNPYERAMYLNRMTGPYWHTYYLLILCNCITIQTLWFPWVRRNVPLLFMISIVVNMGMWLERYVIIVTSLHREYVPAAWGMFRASFWDYGMYYGTIGLFGTLLFLFIRFLPVISITEMRELVHEQHGRAPSGPVAAEPVAAAKTGA